MLETQQPVIAETSRAQAERSRALFDTRLGDSEWVATDRVTVADGRWGK